MKTAYDYNKKIIQNMTPSMSYSGKDYDLWKINAREKLISLLGLDKFEKVASKTQIEYETKIEGATEIRFTFQSEDGYRVPCHLLLPDGVLNPPLMIALQGHSSGMHLSLGRIKYALDKSNIVEGDRDFCIRAVKEGFASVALEQRNFGERGGDENGPNCYESAMTALLSGRTTIAERVWDVIRLIDVIESEFSDKVDITNICCMGNSGGGTATAYVCALEDRIKLAMPSCAICTFKDSIGAMNHCSCNYVPHIAEFFEMNDLISMAFPKFYIQVSGKEDEYFPFEPAEQVFKKGKTIYDERNLSDRCSLVEGFGGHRFYADDAWAIVHKYIG